MKTSFVRALAGIAVLSSLSDHTIAAEPYGLDLRTPIRPFLDGRMPPDQPDAGKYFVVPAFPNLTFQNPVGLIPIPRSNRLCVHTREGTVYTFENDPAVRDKELFLDISSRTQGWDDCGLLGMAFHPEFGQATSTNRGYVYVFYQYSSNPTAGPDRPDKYLAAYNRLSRFTVRDGSRAADPNSELVLIDQYDRSVWHNGGAMFFHPDDGFLYMTVGDEGGADAEFGNAQRLDGGLFSGVIRIDVNQDSTKSHPIRRQPLSQIASRTANYFIPNDNPFQDISGRMLEEFWAIGLRSPHRMTYDPVSKTVWEGEVGQGAREEVNLIVRGGNYQWAYKEGTLEGPIKKPLSLIGKEMPPVYEYSHSRGETQFDGDNCVIGGYVYRGRELADELDGKYIFGDNGSGRIWALTKASDSSVSVVQIATMPAGFGYFGLSSFGIDHNSELYLCQMGPSGKILKLARPTPSVPPPSVLSQTGAFVDLATLKAAPALIPYDVNSPLWSDAAIKTRWMALPNDGAPYGSDERIGFAPVGEWSFPLGTVFVKHFDLAVDESNPARRRRLETRFLVRDTKGGVYGVTYKWRPDNSDADLLSGALSENISIALAGSPPRFDNHQNINNPATSGAAKSNAADGSCTITTAGSQFADTSDRFEFAYQILQGDFDIKGRIDSIIAPGRVAAGLMVRESLTADSRYFLASISYSEAPNSTSTGIYSVSLREQAGGLATAIDSTAPSARARVPNAWIRLQRSGDQFTFYAGDDGISWTKLANRTLALSSQVYFGPAAAAPNLGDGATIRFQNFTHNRAQTWYYPSPRDCVTCHTPAASHVLGVKTSQLNGKFNYAATGRTDNQLRTWNHLELFEPSVDENQIPTFLKLVPVTDSSAPLERRVRSYLAANCSQCHRPSGVHANFDARYETPLPQQNIVNGQLFKQLGIQEGRVVSPSDLAKSLMFFRISSLGENQMPPLARNTFDNAAIAAVAEWINRLPVAGTIRGLRAEYFDNIDLTNLKLTRTDQTVDFDWGTGSPDPSIGVDTFSVRWSGEVQPAFSEPYTFYTTSDDGIRLWINDRLIIDNWTPHAPTDNSGTIELEAGRKYNLRLEFFEDGGGAVARLAWSSPTLPRQIIPANRLSSSADPSFKLRPLLRLEPLANGQMRVVIDADALSNYSVEATSDFRQWNEVTKFLNRAGALEFIDPDARSYHERFYRVVEKQ